MIILDVPSVGGRFMLVDMAGSKNIEAAGQTGFEAKMQDSFEDDKSKILMIHVGIGHNMASGNKENQLLEMKQQCPPKCYAAYRS